MQLPYPTSIHCFFRWHWPPCGRADWESQSERTTRYSKSPEVVRTLDRARTRNWSSWPGHHPCRRPRCKLLLIQSRKSQARKRPHQHPTIWRHETVCTTNLPNLYAILTPPKAGPQSVAAQISRASLMARLQATLAFPTWAQWTAPSWSYQQYPARASASHCKCPGTRPNISKKTKY